MRAQPPQSLSEFEPEDCQTGVSLFDGEADPRRETEVPGSLLDVVAAASPADTRQAPLSRIESRQLRRRTSHLKRFARTAGSLSRHAVARALAAAQATGALAARAWSVTITGASALSQRTHEGAVSTARAAGRLSEQTRSQARSAAEATHQHARDAITSASRLRQHMTAHTIDAARATGRVSDRAWTNARQRFSAPARSRTVLEDLEFNGTIVAMSLAVVALAYGGFQRGPRPAPEAPLAASAVEVEAAPLPITAPAPVLAVPPATTTDATVEPRPAKPALNASTLTAIWKRQDSRSLQQAFTGLRSQTLAFHRCGMRMTDTDRAVATCEGASRAKWTINFQRSAGRWQIDRVTTR